MNVVANSLSYRGALCAWRWLGLVARDSLVGRFFLALARVLVPVFASSHIFGLRHVGSENLGQAEPWSSGQLRNSYAVLALSRAYVYIRNRAGQGLVGRAGKAVRSGVASSSLARGAWPYVVGAGLFTLGCARLGLLLAYGTVDLRLVVSVAVLLVGVLLLASGPRLDAAWADSTLARELGLRACGGRGVQPWQWGEDGPGAGVLVTIGALLAAAAGLIAGVTPGSGAALTVGVTVALCVLALLVARPEAMLIVFAAFPWLDWLARRSLGSIGAGWDESLLIISVVLVLWSLLVLRRGELWTVPVALPALLALAAALGSVTVNEVPGDVAWFSLRVLFQPLVFYFLGFLFPKNRRWLQGAVAVFLLAGAGLALHGLYQYLTHAPMPARWVDIYETDIGTRAYSIIGNPNGLGAFLIMGALVSLSLALAPGLSLRARLWSAGACVVHLAGVAVTFSRGAWIGLAIGGLALLIMAYRRYLAPLAAVSLLAWFLMPQAFVNRLTFAFSSTYITKSLEAGRLMVWKMALERIAAHPWFGVGLGTFGGTSAVTFAYGRLWVDNFYLQLAAEGGLLLLVFFLWMLLRAAKALVRGHGLATDPYLRALSAGVFGAFVAVVVANLTASVWETLAVGVGFWFLAGLATSAAFQLAAEPAAERTSDL